MATFLGRDGAKYSTPQTEAQWMRVVTRAAEEFGWQWMHIGRTGKHVANGAKGTLGVGWPDLFLCGDRGIMFVEVKMEGEELSAAQKQVRSALLYAGADYHVWRPSDFALMIDLLAPKQGVN